MSLARDVRSNPRGYVLGVVSAVVLMVLGAGLALAVTSRVGAAHDGSGDLHACVNRYTGALRYVTDPARCTSVEFPITLAAGGPDAGPDFNVRVKQYEGEFTPGSPMVTADSIACQPGEIAINGGARYIVEGQPTASTDFIVLSSAPLGTPPSEWWIGWMLQVPDADDISVESWVVCVS